jgi:uncharacterized protein YjlB
VPIVDQVKNYARKLAEKQPDAVALRHLLRARKPLAYRFSDDGIIPNHPRWPLLVYRGVIRLDGKTFDPGAVIDVLFDMNGWGRSWRDSIYDFLHYHSRVHEALGVARGHAHVEFGGIKGKALSLKAGDITVLPSGTGHRLLDASRDFLVVGAYPPNGSYDECTDTRDRHKTPKMIAKVKKPACDPVFGKNGPLRHLWSR